MLGHYLRSQFFTNIPAPTKDFSGHTIVVTGSNQGIGLEAARHFVRLKAAKVILAVRTVSKGEAAKRSIEASTGRQDVVQVWPLDLCNYASVQSFAARATASLDRLDALVSNAGINVSAFDPAEDNESITTVNFVSTFLLALLLLPKLRETSLNHNKHAVLTFAGSFLHLVARFEERKAPNILEACADPETTDMSDRYNTSKLMELLATRELAEQLTQSAKPCNIVASIVNPGSVRTNINRNQPLLFRAVMFVLLLIMGRPVEVGGRTMVHPCVAGQESHGQYLDNCEVGVPSDFVGSDEGLKAQKKLWKQLLDKLEQIHPGISANI
ncbi:Short-chain dehydrogenase/reductase family protein [Apiospora rasikravindrae]|uniref:Short-chain dehydrogenase/reductase family protein n=1 Tax=Apiospora rasikravindrae TaxID=990691 RepID=A0ABR1SWL9_9PEZI